MSIIYCYINMFQMEQTIILRSENSTDYKIIGRAPYEYVDHLISSLSDEYMVREVKLGGSKHFTEPLKKRIESEVMARYKKKINVELV